MTRSATTRRRRRGACGPPGTHGDIMAALRCGLYDLSPWLYTEDSPTNAKYRALLDP